MTKDETITTTPDSLHVPICFDRGHLIGGQLAQTPDGDPLLILHLPFDLDKAKAALHHMARRLDEVKRDLSMAKCTAVEPPRPKIITEV